MPDTPEKKKLRPIYSELQGYLSQAPTIKETVDCLYDSSWEPVNSAIELLNELGDGEVDYDRFKIFPENGNDYVRLSVYRTKLGGLISSLHGEYFSDEPAPFSGSPSKHSYVFNNQNSQTQSQQQEQKMEIDQMLQNTQEMIQAEYGKEQADKASSLIKQIILNPKNWSIIATSITGLLAIGKVAFIAAVPILGKILLGASPVLSA